ncbi:hypothetical protein C0J29_31700 (plasmid) [Mycobacterium paragordonae]|uniref:CRISPR type III-associated protein domain-containing protein n=1 Tax=Mycobacterium paragordonae TaxID=1389713 RepID=A0ABQ1CG99_9MYCO|nr:MULTISPECIES: RAMP superfamily CRISPR-associated protein [Mycobacterium]AYE99532.1 hypothetical protein C0J29_31700 [Mycobacterium paragordonae]QNI09774.1 hypothetical protein GAN17_25625 [Mycobacterium kubicae]GFG83255.1 hypothetical protein MPRG_65310 [Mycobacterium paragordonae]
MRTPLICAHWDIQILARSAIVHRDDDDNTAGSDTFSLFRREDIIGPDGSQLQVPIISGNSFRGILRRTGEALTAAVLNYENQLPVPAAHLLSNGGRLAKARDAKGRTPFTDEQERRLKDLIPHIAVFGGAASGRIMSGLLMVGKVLPEVSELAHILPLPPANPPSPAMLALGEEFFTHLNDHRRSIQHPPGPDPDRTTSPLGRYSGETLRAGTHLQTFIRINNATPIQLAFLRTVLDDFSANGHLGGRTAAGYGRISATSTMTVIRGADDTGADWASQLAERRDEALAALTQLT